MKSNNIFSAFFFLLFLSFQSKAQLIPDSTYSQDGYFISPDPGYGTFASKILELDNGSIIAAGTIGPLSKLRVWKYDPSGKPDSLFGTNGIASNAQLDTEPGYIFYVKDIDTLDDGKIMVLTQQVISGATIDLNKYAIVLIRFNANGTIDQTFNSTGYLIDKPVNNYEYVPTSMAIDKLGDNETIYVGCWVAQTGHASCPAGLAKWCISKYTHTGAKDMTFNNNTGYIQEDADVIMQGFTAAPLATIHDMRVMPNGKLVVAGSFYVSDNAFFSFKLLNNGQWDSSFGTNGRCVHPVQFYVPTNDLTKSQVLVDGSSFFCSILRYTSASLIDSAELFGVKNTATGVPSTTFGINGVLNFSYYSQQYPIFAFKSDLSFLFAYYRIYGAQFADQKIEFMRFNTNGIQDMSFGTNGLLKTSPRSPDNYVNRSGVWDAIWTKNETGIYLACSNQIPGTNGQIGIFKYKWPGLTPLQIDEKTIYTKLNVYPIPCSNSLTIEVPKEIENGMLRLFDMQGKLISSYLLSTQLMSLNTASLPNGLYFVQLSKNNFSQTQKVIIRH